MEFCVVRPGDMRQKKSLGQVFLKTTWPCERIVTKLKQWHATRVLEIGPGGGVLTRSLLDAGFKVTAVEKDSRFCEKLVDFKQANRDKNFEIEIINLDILKFDLENWLSLTKEPTAIVGNIPYNISSPILMYLLPYLNDVVGVNLMVQLEFGQRLAAQPGSKSFGSLSVFTQLRSRVSLDCTVPRNCFQPVPKVDSALVSLSAPSKIHAPKILQKVEHVTRLAFQQRRKKLHNSISSILDKAPNDTCPIDLTRRPETLSPDEFIQLALYFFPD